MSRPVQGALLLVLSGVVVKGSQTAVLLILAKFLAPSEIGVLAIGALVLNMANTMTDLGATGALVYWRGDGERAARSALTIGVCVSAAFLASGWFLAPSISALSNAGPVGVAVIRGLLLSLPFMAIAGVSQELMRRELRFARRVLPDIASALVGLVVSLWLALAGHGVYALVIGQVVQSVVCVLVCWLVRRPVLPGWSRRDAAALIDYGRHVVGADILKLALLNVDYMMVAHTLGSGPLGEYSLAFRLAYMPFLLVASPIGGTAFPYLCRMSGGSIGRAAGKVGVVTIAVVLPLYLGGFLLAGQVELLGEKWDQTVVALQWLCVYGFGLSMLRLCEVPLKSVGRVKDCLWLNGLHLFLVVAMLFVATRWGIEAVSVGQAAVCGAIAVVALIVVAARVEGLRWRDWSAQLMCCLGAAVIMTGVVATLEVCFYPLSQVSAEAVVVLVLVGATAYLGPLWLFGRGPLRAIARRDIEPGGAEQIAPRTA